MAQTTFSVRLFGGRDLGVTYDDGAGTLSILGQSISISSLPSSLQTEWQTALSSGGNSIASPTTGRSPFGGTTIQAAIGDILDNQTAWRTSVRAALPPQNADGFNR